MSSPAPASSVIDINLKSLTQLDEVYRYRLLVESVLDYAIYLLDPEGYVRTWNSGAQRFKGYSSTEIIGQHFSCFYTDEDRANKLPARALAIAAEEGRFEAEGWRVRKDGTRFWTSVVIDAIRNGNGALIGYAKVTRDITGKKQAAEDLQIAKESLHQAQKMEAIGRLTGGVAHDFNNLLTVIRGSAEMLRNPKLSAEKRMRYVDAIAKTADRAAHLTKQLLAYARQQPLHPVTFEVGRCIESMKELFRATTGSSVELSYSLPTRPCYVCADANQLETALLNIVINARDAMPAGGRLTIDVSTVKSVPATPQNPVTAGEHVAIHITDTGTGMPADIRDRIFEPFYTTKPPGRGTGLGLSQVIGFVTQSGGRVDVSSDEGAGTSFTLYLPLTEPAGYEDLISPGSDDLSWLKPPAYRILLVEDNKDVGEIVTSLLNDLGQRSTLAPNGHAALDTLEKEGGAFDLVLTDIVMPEMSGLELARTIRARWPQVKVMLASGYNPPLSRADAGSFELLHKPYSKEALVQVIETLKAGGSESRQKQ